MNAGGGQKIIFGTGTKLIIETSKIIFNDAYSGALLYLDGCMEFNRFILQRALIFNSFKKMQGYYIQS